MQELSKHNAQIFRVEFYNICGVIYKNWSMPTGRQFFEYDSYYDENSNVIGCAFGALASGVTSHSLQTRFAITAAYTHFK